LELTQKGLKKLIGFLDLQQNYKPNKEFWSNLILILLVKKAPETIASGAFFVKKFI